MLIHLVIRRDEVYQRLLKCTRLKGKLKHNFIECYCNRSTHPRITCKWHQTVKYDRSKIKCINLYFNFLFYFRVYILWNWERPELKLSFIYAYIFQ
jgi:hypothetical protein